MEKAQEKESAIAIIPARGGSKRLPGKNIKSLCSKPMIAYTIEAAINSGCFGRVIVSTEDEGIACVSRDRGAQVSARPVELATDISPTMSVIFRVIEEMAGQNNTFDTVALLQPTSPLRDAGDVKAAMELFFANDCDSVVSMYEPPVTPYWLFKEENGFVLPLFSWDYLSARSQDLPRSYLPNGAIYIVSTAALNENKKFYTSRTLPYIMPADRSIDIDTLQDFSVAEQYIKDHKQ